MKFSTLLTLSLVYITTVSATPTARSATCSNGRKAASNTCCVWYDVLDDIQSNLFEGGTCGENAHDALRLSFHDAIGYSPLVTKQGKFGGGGADGSVIAFSAIELAYAANEGLEDIVEAEKRFADHHNVSYGDIIQFAAAVSVRNCAGGPRISFLAGRPAAVQAAPNGLVPEPFDSVDTMLARVGDAGLTPEELVDLLASHSVGVQEHVDRTIPNTPFDSTPTIFDTNFYLETLLPGTTWPGTPNNKGEVQSPSPDEFRLASDAALARDSRTSCHWQSFVGDQPRMTQRFGTAMAKMALLGHDANSLQDCSVVIPPPTLPAPAAAKLPVGKTPGDLELTCPAAAFRRTPGLERLKDRF
ncbi:manganese peroxidase 1 [Mycena epipterygia]|nr:manganese peroxidase 1 [Mycena epipterygia]